MTSMPQFFGSAPDYDALHTYVGLKLPFEQQACGLCGVRDSGLCHSIHPRDITLICLDERTQTQTQWSVHKRPTVVRFL